jgi:hypothetical protein
MNVIIGAEAAQRPRKGEQEYINGIFVAVYIPSNFCQEKVSGAAIRSSLRFLDNRNLS